MNKIEEILEGYKNDVLTYIDREGEHKVNIDEFIKTGGLQVLQKLNRTEEVLTKLANKAPEKLKWVNDYAMAQVVKRLYDKVDVLSHSIIEKDTEIERLNNESVASRVAVETNDCISKEEADKLLERIAGMEADEQIIQSQLDQIINERDTALENENVAIKQYNDLKERFDNSVAEYKKVVEERDSVKSAMDHQYMEMNDDYNKLESEYVGLENKLKYSNSKIEKLTAKINELEQLKTDAQQECYTYAGEFEKAMARCNEIDSKNEDLQKECDRQQDLIEGLEKSYDEACVAKYALEEEVKNLKESFGEATGKIRNLDSTNVELQNKVTEQDNLINGLNDTIESLTNEKTELENGIAEKIKEISLLNAQIRHSQDDTEKLKKFEGAVNAFLLEIGWVDDKAVTETPVRKDNTQHRMGDNQVVDFNLGQ